MASPARRPRAARDAMLARVRTALGKTGDRGAARAAAEVYVAAHAQGPRPRDRRRPRRALHAARAATWRAPSSGSPTSPRVPQVVARYLDALQLPPALAAQQSRAGVCWPEFAGLDWAGAGLAIEARPTEGDDRLGITGLLLRDRRDRARWSCCPGRDSPTATTLLPDTHVAVLRAERIVAGMEDAFALIRRERGAVPRAINMISGPSRTGDIEQTIVLGAHGPFRVHILLVG